MGWKSAKTFFHLKYQADYAMAVKTFVSLSNNAKRGDPNHRWLTTKTKNEYVRKDSNDEIVFAYNSGDQVSFYPTGEVYVQNAYWTGSSTSFVNAVTGPRVEFGMTADDSGTVAITSDDAITYHKIGPSRRQDVTFWIDRDGAWTPKSGFEAFTVPTFDRKAATAALKRSGAADFIAWARTIVGLGGWSPAYQGDLGGLRTEAPSALHLNTKTSSGRNEIMMYLALEDRWMDILQSPTLTDYARKYEADKALTRVVEGVRRAVYASTPGVVTVSEQLHIVGGAAFRTYRNAKRAYDYVGS